ncbi:membrane progestin receptor alpha-B-like [Babylonia areolata]|uniref:membrane progestin receptor alpha-B-like n=1 Tax=Babylonia areolata TaxID=304850 RepID=UPI003FD3876C
MARKADCQNPVYNNNVNEDDSENKPCLKDSHKSEKKRQNKRRLMPQVLSKHKNSCKPCSTHETINAECVELVNREPYILTGYRLSNQPWCYYIGSLCWIHNETVNVWTHLTGCVLLVVHAAVLGMRLDSFRDLRAGLVVAFTLTCFISNLFSSLAHLLHSRTAKHHYLLYFVDYAGICIYNFGNGIDALYSCSTAEEYRTVKTFFLPLLMVCCYISFVAILVARLKFQGTKYERKRKVVMTLIYLVLMCLIAWPIISRYVRCFRDEDCSVSSLNHITVIFVFFVLDGVSFTALLPEKLRPGMFDIWGHSHQWFHVLVMITQQLQLYALHVDYVDRGRAGHVKTPLSSLLITLGLLMVMQAVTIKLMTPAIERKVEEGSRLDESAPQNLVVPSVEIDVDIGHEESGV